MRVWPAILSFLDRDGPAALVSVVAVAGSTPREAGARLVVRADGSFTGTIGGGTLEWIALAEARKLLGGDAWSLTLDKALGPDLGQCCGGRATLRIERFAAADRAWIAPLAAAEASGPILTHAVPDARGVLVRRLGPMAGGLAEAFGDAATPVRLFGAGHVGRALVLALAPLPFRITWIDPRPDAFPQHVPPNVDCVVTDDPAATLADTPPGAFVAVMTHSHALDLAVVAAALRDNRFPYVGLIGSATKRARFARQLADAGHPPETIGRLVCPIGVRDIMGKEPAVIAAGIAVQFLLERQRLSQVHQPAVRMIR